MNALGLVQLGARLYDPAIGRFLSRDPMFDPNNPNPYAFAANDPVNASDPGGNTIVFGGLDLLYRIEGNVSGWAIEASIAQPTETAGPSGSSGPAPSQPVAPPAPPAPLPSPGLSVPPIVDTGGGAILMPPLSGAPGSWNNTLTLFGSVSTGSASVPDVAGTSGANDAPRPSPNLSSPRVPDRSSGADDWVEAIRKFRARTKQPPSDDAGPHTDGPDGKHRRTQKRRQAAGAIFMDGSSLWPTSPAYNAKKNARAPWTKKNGARASRAPCGCR